MMYNRMQNCLDSQFAVLSLAPGFESDASSDAIQELAVAPPNAKRHATIGKRNFKTMPFYRKGNSLDAG